MNWQYQFAGNMTQNLQLLVCQRCMDVPQEQLRTVVLPPDPLPIMNPRPENFDAANNDYRILEDGVTYRVLQDGTVNRVPEQTGDDALVNLEDKG